MSDRTHPFQQTIDLCQAALDSVRGEPGEKQYARASDFVSRYDEWLIGLEFAIDCLVEGERRVPQASNDAFECVYLAMRISHDARLRHLRDLVAAAER